MSSSPPRHHRTLETKDFETSSLDNRRYCSFWLENRVEVLIAHDPETDKASASMDVNVGRSDEDIPGTAVAVAHALSDDNVWESYLSSHSGKSGVSAGNTSTRFSFNIAAKQKDDEEPLASDYPPLKGALERLGHLFIGLKFSTEDVDRWLHLGNPVYKRMLNDDDWQQRQVDKSISNPEHPYSRSSVVNFEVLKVQLESQGVDIRQKLQDFFDKYYSANGMKLVVIAPEPLDVLKEWVSDYFSTIPNKDTMPKLWQDVAPFTPDQLALQIFTRPIKDIRSLRLCFPFLNEDKLYEAPPSRYIKRLLGDRGPGSIMSYLKSKCWAHSLDTDVHIPSRGGCSILECQIRLTKEGLKNYRGVAKAFFQYISLLREGPPQEWIFEEQRQMADIDFEYGQTVPPMPFANNTSSIMQSPIPRQWLAGSHSRLREFDPKLIQTGIDCLQPNNLRMTIVSQITPVVCDRKEKWSGTEYTSEKIPEDLMQELKQACSATSTSRPRQLHLPCKNRFIPMDLGVQMKVKEPPGTPRIIWNDALARTWYKKDDTFGLPQAYAVAICQSPIIYASAENFVKTRLYIDLVKDALADVSHDAGFAGLRYNLTIEFHDLSISVSGYNDKLFVLMVEVLQTMRDLEIKEADFIAIKERLTEELRNSSSEPSFRQAGTYSDRLVIGHVYLAEECEAKLEAIAADDVRSFRKALLSQLHIEVLVHGNVRKKDALDFTGLVVSIFKPSVLPHWPTSGSLSLPPGSSYIFEKTLDAEMDNCIETWICVGDGADPMIRSKTLLLRQLLGQPIVAQLLSKEHLGSLVAFEVKAMGTTLGIRFLIQSDKTPGYLDARIENFLNNWKETLEQMSEPDFEIQKKSLVDKCLMRPSTLFDEGQEALRRLRDGSYNFEQSQQDAAHIRRLGKRDMTDYFRQFFDPGSPTRAKLSIYMTAASGVAERDGELPSFIRIKPAVIKDIEGFRSSLPVRERARSDMGHGWRSRLVSLILVMWARASREPQDANAKTDLQKAPRWRPPRWNGGALCIGERDRRSGRVSRQLGFGQGRTGRRSRL